MREDMWSGWGIRTMSTGDSGTLLGLDAGDHGLTARPHLPPELGQIELDRIPVRGLSVRAS